MEGQEGHKYLRALGTLSLKSLLPPPATRMTSTSSGYPTSLALLGGIPVKSQDLAPYAFCSLALSFRVMPSLINSHVSPNFVTCRSIIFALAYSLLLPVVIWRLVTPASRCLTLIRPAIFISIRIGTFIVRAIQSDGHYETGLFIADQVRLAIATVLPAELHEAHELMRAQL